MTHSDDALRWAIEVALNEAERAVGGVSAPITGTPYQAGPRPFCAAIRALYPDDILKKVKDNE